MDEKRIKSLVSSIELIFGNPIEADAREVDVLFAEFADGKDAAQIVFDLASKAAQKYRLEGEKVPTHVVEALNSTKRALHGEGGSTSVAIVDALLNPILGPVEQVSYAFRNRRERTSRDADLLEELSKDVKKDWSEDQEK
jgi:hypothetical protein